MTARLGTRPAALAATTALVLAASACSGDGPAPTPTSTAARTAAPQPTTAQKAARASLIFGSTGNAFRLDISRAPVAKDSAAQVRHLMSQITPNYGGTVALNAYAYNSSFWVAGPADTKTRVGFDNCQNKPSVPKNLYDGMKYFVDVPIPAKAVPAEGTDGLLAIWSPASDQLWEFWVPKKNPKTGAWTACWGGRIDHVSTRGRGDFPVPYGASASGLATVASMITIAEAQAMRIEHAMQLGLLYIKAGEAAYPAVRTDGLDADPAALVMGTRLRLPRTVDIEKLDLPPLGKAIARAAQQYGFVVTETSGAVGVGTESPQATMAAGKPDPWPAVFAGTSEYDQLKGFPWASLEVVEPGYGAPAGTPRTARFEG